MRALILNANRCETDHFRHDHVGCKCDARTTACSNPLDSKLSNNTEKDGGAAPHIETAPDYNHTLHEHEGRTNLEMNIPDSAGLEQTRYTSSLS